MAKGSGLAKLKAMMMGGAMPMAKAKPKPKAHSGFKAVQNKIAQKEGISNNQAGAILAASTRKASAKAKTKNPALKKVKGK